MTTIAEVRDAIANCIDTIPGLRSAAYIQDQITPPIAHVMPLDFDPRLVFSEAKSVYKFQIRVYVGRTPAEQNQAALDTYREVHGSHSITAAVQDDTNWGGVEVDYAKVTRIGSVGVAEVGGVPYLVLQIDVEVLW